MSEIEVGSPDITTLTSNIVSAYVANNSVGVEKLPELINSVRDALGQSTSASVEPEGVDRKPAVPIKKSVTPDYIFCLEDGKRFKSLKRHLRTSYNLSPEEYRERWRLPASYPMVAASYAAARSNLAKASGLGKRP